MSEELVECYGCGGKGQCNGHRDYIDAQGRRRGQWGTFECSLCNGTGKISAQKRAEYDVYAERQRAIREEAKRRGVACRLAKCAENTQLEHAAKGENQ